MLFLFNFYLLFEKKYFVFSEKICKNRISKKSFLVKIGNIEKVTKKKTVSKKTKMNKMRKITVVEYQYIVDDS